MADFQTHRDAVALDSTAKGLESLTDSGTSTHLPKLSYLVRDELLQRVLGFFSERTGVRVWFQDSSGYTVAPETNVPAFCSMLINLGRCGLANPEVPMPADPEQPTLRMCVGGIGHVIIPIVVTTESGATMELGRVITEPLAVRETDFSETFAEARKLHTHPDNLAAAAKQIVVIDRGELNQLTSIVGLVVSRVAQEKAGRARNLALAEAFEEVGLRGNREIINELLTGLVQDFTDADATVLTTDNSTHETAEHQPVFSPDLDEEKRRLILQFTGEVTRWISQTGYPISFPDLGGSAWCKHVLGGQLLEGSLVAVPVKLPGEWRGWWSAYYRRPMAQMEDQLHRLSVLAAHSAQTLAFMSRLEASQEAALTDALTGLHNRRFLVEQLDRELARSTRNHDPVSLIIFDVDNFKDINDTYGHVAGDMALRHVGSVLSIPLRRSSTICRYGGDEFCVVVPECGEEEAELVARRLKAEIEERPLTLEGDNRINIKVSGGVATQHPEAASDIDLFQLADDRLIHAKREGKDRISVK